MKIKIEDIILEQAFASKEEAINFVGALMVERNYVTEDYIASMHERDHLSSTFIGNHVAIPHGTDAGREFINESAVVLVQVPAGVRYNDNDARLIFGIAGKDNEQVEILANIAIVCSEMENVTTILAAEDAQVVADILNGEQE